MLGDYDIYGMPLTTWFSPRVNLLVDDSERVQIEGRPFLHAKQVTIEGSIQCSNVCEQLFSRVGGHQKQRSNPDCMS